MLDALCCVLRSRQLVLGMQWGKEEEGTLAGRSLEAHGGGLRTSFLWWVICVCRWCQERGWALIQMLCLTVTPPTPKQHWDPKMMQPSFCGQLTVSG